MNVRRHSLTLLITGGLITSLGACKGDDGGDDGADASGTETDPGTSGASNTMSTTQSSETLTTVDPTADTTDSDPSDTTADPTVDPDSSTGEPTAGTAFRFNSVAVRDPHAVLAHESQVNEPLNNALNMDGDDDTRPDGLYDLGFVLIFDPLDQTEGGTGGFAFANADCSVGDDPVDCALEPGTAEFPTTYTSQSAGVCQEPNPANINASYDPPAGTTTGPCFVTASASVTIQTTTFALPLQNATVAARYVGDPAGNLVEGTVIGFVTNEDAEAAMVPTPLGEQALSNLLVGTDRDEDGSGWWFHIDFTAVPATWNG